MVRICSSLVIFVTSLLPMLTSSLSECSISAVFNFGDSNSDTGGLFALFGESAAKPPNGETFFHSPAGRVCDGRLLIDFIAEDIGLPYLSPFLDSIGTNFSHGANFATIGSTILRQNTTIYQSGFSPVALDVQYAEFNNFLKRTQIIRERGEIFTNLLPSLDKFSSALYVFDIGQNDLTSGYQLGMSTNDVKAQVPDVISQYMTIIKKLYASGGRAFWIHNTGPIGCLPFLLTTQSHLFTPEQLDQYGCAEPINDVSKYFNEKLNEAVVKLRKDLQLAAFTYVDIYSIKYSLIAQAEELGFGDPLLVCCGYGGGKYNFDNAKRCGATKTVDGKKILVAKSCEDPSSRILWDGIHFTEVANKWIFGQIANGSFSDPRVPLKMACHQKEDSSHKSNDKTMDFM